MSTEPSPAKDAVSKASRAGPFPAASAKARTTPAFTRPTHTPLRNSDARSRARATCVAATRLPSSP